MAKDARARARASSIIGTRVQTRCIAHKTRVQLALIRVYTSFIELESENFILLTIFKRKDIIDL